MKKIIFKILGKDGIETKEISLEELMKKNTKSYTMEDIEKALFEMDSTDRILSDFLTLFENENIELIDGDIKEKDNFNFYIFQLKNYEDAKKVMDIALDIFDKVGIDYKKEKNHIVTIKLSKNQEPLEVEKEETPIEKGCLIKYNPSKQLDELNEAIRWLQNDTFDVFGTKEKKLKVLKELREILDYEYEEEVKAGKELEQSLAEEEERRAKENQGE